MPTVSIAAIAKSTSPLLAAAMIFMIFRALQAQHP